MWWLAKPERASPADSLLAHASSPPGSTVSSKDSKSASNRISSHEVVQSLRLGARSSLARLVFHDRLHGGRLFAYLQLGRQEDPDFTIKTMVVQAQWPGASPEEMTRQITDRIEKKLEELESLDYTKSVTVAGQTTVFVYLRDSTKAADVKPTWIRVRNMIADIKGDFPQGVIGPGFNDRFGDVFGNIYAFTSDGLSQRQLRDHVEDIRAKVLTVPMSARWTSWARRTR
jgi:hypothetical protein